ncbi:MAG: hypothetical protein ABSB78_04175 [Bacteroidota bacterium]
MILTVGPYYLTQQINTAEGLKEFSEEDYLSAEFAGMKRVLENERFFNGINVQFAATHWDSTMIASTNGQIYKISLQFDDWNKTLAKMVLQTTLAFVNSEIGKYSEHPLFSNKYIWDTKEGNIILYEIRRFQIYSVNIFFTSSIIRSQMAKLIGAV